MAEGSVIVNTGDGKGKSTAALGMVLRAVGHGMRVLVVHFVKAAKNTGELKALENIEDVTVKIMGLGFLGNEKHSREEHVEAAREAYEYSKKHLSSGDFQMVVLDEIIFAVKEGLLSEKDICELISARPVDVHLVLTGRGCPDSIAEKADIVTEMTTIKHSFDRGAAARPGVEF